MHIYVNPISYAPSICERSFETVQLLKQSFIYEMYTKGWKIAMLKRYIGRKNQFNVCVDMQFYCTQHIHQWQPHWMVIFFFQKMYAAFVTTCISIPLMFCCNICVDKFMISKRMLILSLSLFSFCLYKKMKKDVIDKMLLYITIYHCIS